GLLQDLPRSVAIVTIRIAAQELIQPRVALIDLAAVLVNFCGPEERIRQVVAVGKLASIAGKRTQRVAVAVRQKIREAQRPEHLAVRSGTGGLESFLEIGHRLRRLQ